MAAPAKSKKKIKTTLKIYAPAGQANPAPPIGPAGETARGATPWVSGAAA